MTIVAVDDNSISTITRSIRSKVDTQTAETETKKLYRSIGWGIVAKTPKERFTINAHSLITRKETLRVISSPKQKRVSANGIHSQFCIFCPEKKKKHRMENTSHDTSLIFPPPNSEEFRYIQIFLSHHDATMTSVYQSSAWIKNYFL
jgi:hypothetical protein